MIADPAQLDLALELVVSETFSTDRVLEWIPNDGLYLPCMAFIPTAFLGCLLRSDSLQADNAAREAFGKFPGVITDNRFENLDVRHEAVGRSRDGGELCVVGSNAFNTVHFHLNLLPRPQLRDQDVWIDGPDGTVAGEKLLLTADRMEGNVFRIYVSVIVELPRVILIRCCIRVLGAFDVEPQDNRIIIARRAATVGIIIGRFLEPSQPIDTLYRAFEWDQS